MVYVAPSGTSGQFRVERRALAGPSFQRIMPLMGHACASADTKGLAFRGGATLVMSGPGLNFAEASFLAVKQDRRPKGFRWFPDANGAAPLLGKPLGIFTDGSHAFEGVICIGEGLGPWLFVPFGTAFRCFGARVQTSGSSTSHLGV